MARKLRKCKRRNLILKHTFDKSWNFGKTPWTIIKHVLTIIWSSMKYLLFKFLLRGVKKNIYFVNENRRKSHLINATDEFNKTKRRFAKWLLVQTSNEFSGDKFNVVLVFGRFMKEKKAKIQSVTGRSDTENKRNFRCNEKWYFTNEFKGNCNYWLSNILRELNILVPHAVGK